MNSLALDLRISNYKVPSVFYHLSFWKQANSLRIGWCFACVYRVMDARGTLGGKRASSNSDFFLIFTRLRVCNQPIEAFVFLCRALREFQFNKKAGVFVGYVVKELVHSFSCVYIESSMHMGIICIKNRSYDFQCWRRRASLIISSWQVQQETKQWNATNTKPEVVIEVKHKMCQEPVLSVLFDK